jgi:SAM-dependent methyltransferase
MTRIPFRALRRVKEVDMAYDPKNYWRNLHDRRGLSGVGQSGLGDEINTWIYRTIRHNLRGFARRHDLRPRGSGNRLLEVGVGSGYWVPLWQDLGWNVDGCDLVPSTVERLRTARPDLRFWVADVGSKEGVLAGADGAADGYDMVTALSIVLHVTRDDAFDCALTNLAAAVRPGGRLLMMEPVLTRRRKEPPYDPEKHSRARLLRSYRDPLEGRLGMKLEAVEPATALAANPLEAGRRIRLAHYRRWWRIVQRTKQKPGAVRWVGPTMYGLDRLALRLGEAPTAKLMLFRKPG